MDVVPWLELLLDRPCSAFGGVDVCALEWGRDGIFICFPLEGSEVARLSKMGDSDEADVLGVSMMRASSSTADLFSPTALLARLPERPVLLPDLLCRRPR